MSAPQLRADQRQTQCINRAAHAARSSRGVRGIKDTQAMLQSSCKSAIMFSETSPNETRKLRWRLKDAFGFALGLPNGLRYPRWGGQRNAVRL